MAKLFDAIILGGGPAGLSVALGLSRINRTCIVISSGSFRNDGIEASHGVLGHDHIHPQTTWARGREQIDRYGTTIYANANIISAEKLKDNSGFSVTSDDDRSWRGRTLVFATGVKDLLPDVKGYKENWPQNIYQCPFCDGWERKDSQKAVLGLDECGIHAFKTARMISNFDGDGPSKVTILANGHAPDTSNEAAAKTYAALKSQGVKFDDRKIVELVDATPEEGVDVVFEDGQRSRFGFIMHKPSTAPRAETLIKQLGLETTPGMFGDFIKTFAPMQSTNVVGVFAVGDVGNNLTHVSTAMSSGIGAAAGIAHYLGDLEDEKWVVPIPA